MEIAMSNNNERADRAESALWTYLEHAQPFRKNYASAEWQAGIAGLIGDLLHLASRAELDPISVAQQGLVKFECDRRWPVDGIAPDRNDIVDVRITTEHRHLQHVRIDRKEPA
jgi:hypothetical protein